MKTLPDGSMLLMFSDQFSDVLLNGVSASSLGIIEAKIWPDGWGFIVTEKETTTDTENTLFDGQTLTHVKWGEVSISGLQECET